MYKTVVGWAIGQEISCQEIEDESQSVLSQKEHQLKTAAIAKVKELQAAIHEDGFVLVDTVLYCVYHKNQFVDTVKGSSVKEIKKKIRSSCN